MIQQFLLKVSRNSGPETVEFPKCEPFNQKFFLEIFENTVPFATERCENSNRTFRLNGKRPVCNWPRRTEIVNNGNEKFWGLNKVHYGICENGKLLISVPAAKTVIYLRLN